MDPPNPLVAPRTILGVHFFDDTIVSLILDFFFELRTCLDLALAAESVYVEIMYEYVCFWMFENYVRAPGILGVDFILCSKIFLLF